jgi:HAD superfamily phosphatase (TIGR01668 family)
VLHHFCPRLVVPAVTALKPEFFHSHGLKAALLDLDNTLVLWHGAEVQQDVAEWVRCLQAAGVRFCLASNTHRPRRLSMLGEALGVPFELGVAKPGRAGLLRCLARVEAAPEETAMIGDQVLTDIWGGNRCGLYTILVQPISRHEFIGTRFVSRPLERILLCALRRQGMLHEEASAAVPAR